MKKTSIIIVVLLLSIALLSCEEHDKEQKISNDFCSYVSNESVDGTIPIINDYLNSLDNNLTDSIKLVKLTNALKEKSCVAEAKLVCFECIFTNPPMSEIYVTFQLNGGETKFMNLDIQHQPLKATVYHQIIID
ncbi:hypothetical protein AGMMS50262_00970 [Bacteroidia bacterium]|nr:hypothetical protein AGMMS50262_00970 [Bacteroidia bacterium]